MVDIELMLKMKGENNKPESKSKKDDLAWEEEIDAFADDLATQAIKEQNESSLVSVGELKSRLKEEFKEVLMMKETEKLVGRAIELLNEEGPHYPDQDQWNLLSKEFKNAVSLLQKARSNPQPDLTETFQKKAGLSDASMQCIDQIANRKYNENDYESSKTLYFFLSLLNNTNFDYWQRLAICHQELNEFAQAIRYYDNAWMIRQDNIPNRLFVSECYSEIGEKNRAQECCDTARQLIESQNEQQTWQEHLTALEEMIAALP